MRKRSTQVFEGSGNVFADIGVGDAGDMLVKAQIVVELSRLIAVRKLTQTKAARLLGVAQPDLSKILHGHFRGYSVERLIRMLTAFDQDVDIVIRPIGRGKGPGRIKVTPVAA